MLQRILYFLCIGAEILSWELRLLSAFCIIFFSILVSKERRDGKRWKEMEIERDFKKKFERDAKRNGCGEEQFSRQRGDVRRSR